ncbi:MAG TPA: alpha-L-rhamnosidase N-terminal domain-containing protein, partial [Myxococcota bacterium]|nr:alpha-L-rhamnosidase N-terminal domain-containing protein [Myxococcota bacterium]
MAERARRTGGKSRRRFLRRLGASLAASLAAPGAVAAQARKKATPRQRPSKPKAPAAPAKSAAPRPAPAPPPEPATVRVARGGWPLPEPGARVDLAPARWIWLPGERTLANTFVLFRHELELAQAPSSARGFVSADSRYRLFVNGRRVQWGPAPCDPRSYEADPIDLARWLVPGRNVIGAEVLFYGHGDGTWPFGKPGFLFALRVEEPGGRMTEVRSDDQWRVFLDRAHRPGQFKRWYLRALQEDFDARLHPWGWSAPGFAADEAWLEPQLVEAAADRPAAAAKQADYLGDTSLEPEATSLRAREVPLVRETLRPLERLVRSGRVRWRRDPRDWFEFRVPGSFEIVDESAATPAGESAWRVEPRAREGVFLTFELPEQMVGFPYLTVEAPAGTVVELLTQESHDPSGPAWLDTQRFGWTRFVCRGGENRFECFDYESLRFLQLHVHDAEGPVVVRDVGLRRRSYAWPSPPSFRVSEPSLQRVLEACFNTLTNSAQETIVDGMGRERQQYSGDVSHQLHATRLVCGDRQLSRRFLRSFALGQTLEGYFLDCWPAFDRLNRLAQRQLGATRWGPLLDHGVSFVSDAWRHYEETGDSELPLLLYPGFVRFAAYLLERRGKDGLLPVEGWGVPAVWIDDGFQKQRHKLCAFNLFTAGVLKSALAPLAALAGDAAGEKRFAAAADLLTAAAVARFWSRERSLFVSNLPWQDEEGGERRDDRSLASALLFDQCPGGRVRESLQALAQPNEGLVLSYPANSHWRMRALARHGRIDAVLRELRERWARLPSVLKNNTTPERWDVRPDSTDQWSHCAVGPLTLLYRNVAGVRPAAPGFAKAEIRPQLGDLKELELVCHTPRGPITFRAEAQEEGHRAFVTLPAECPGELVLP